MRRHFGYLTLIAGLVISQARGQQGTLPRPFTGNTQAVAGGFSGSQPSPQGRYQVEFPTGQWVVANKRSGKYRVGRETEVLFTSIQAAEAAGYRPSASTKGMK